MASGLSLYASTRLDDLLELLAAITGKEPLSPLQEETIVVPTQGIARWVRQRLAHKRGIAASLRLPFLGGFLRRLADGDSAAPDPLAKDELTLRLWRLVRAPGAARDYGPAFAYCRDDADGRLRLQLCERLARVFDDYQVYRPDLLARWTAGDDAADAGEHAPWQGRLWRALLADAGFGRAGGPAAAAAIRLREVERRLGAEADARRRLPPRVHVFGATALPPAFLRLLLACSEHTPVHLYVPQPADLRDGDSSNAWLDRFGLQAREFAREFADLAASGYAGIARLDVGAVVRRHEAPSERRTALAVVQARIADLSGDSPPRPPIAADDDSLRVHVAHSPQRELEIVRDQLLAAFAADRDLQPQDVFVLVPDIEQYAAMADAVFGPVREHLPYRVADRSPIAEQPLCSALFAVLDLARGRVEAGDVFRVLEQEAVRQRFDLGVGDLPALRARCDAAGVRWGVDGARRAARLGLPAFDDGSWRAGLDRLLLGVMTGPGEALALGLSPVADATSGRDDAFGRFLAFCTALFERLDLLAAPRPLAAWADRLDDLLAALFLPTSAEDRAAAERLRRAIARLRAIATAAAVDEPVAAVVLRDWLDGALAESSGGGFLSGSITIASLTPMRTLPCRRLYVCGLSDQQFPRRPQALPFDLIAQRRRAGDRDARRDDRQLFLDLLTSARDAVHLLYVGRSAKDDAECAPSTLLDELLELVDATFAPGPDGAPARAQVVVPHPLQPWSRRYRDGRDPRLFAYAVGHGGALPDTRSDAAPWSDDAPAEPPAELQGQDLALADLVAFWRDPPRFFCERVLGMTLRAADAPEPVTEPFALDGLGNWQLRDTLLRRDVPGEGEADRMAAAHAAGLVPPGSRGDLAFHDGEDEAQVLRRCLRAHGALASVPVAVAADDGRVAGTLEGVAADALVRAQAGKLKAKHRLAAFVAHVVAAVARGAGGALLPDASVQYGLGETQRLRPLDGDAAQAALAVLVAGFRAGLRRPLPFFPAASLAHAEARAKGDDDAVATRRARAAFAGHGDGSTGEADDAATALCWRGRDPLGHPDFAEWAERVGRALAACEELA
ncbi:MAG: exodeoxyribonuclease V subunit gamma [Planctomycetota bacterium]